MVHYERNASELVSGFMHKQLYKYLKPYNSLHLRPDERKYYTASTEKYASGTIRRLVQQPQRLCLEYGVNCIKCHSEEVTEKQPRIWIQSATVNKCTTVNAQCKNHCRCTVFRVQHCEFCLYSS